MSSKVLKIDYDYDFELIGISNNLRDYKLCWALNTQLSWNLEKQHDILIPWPKIKPSKTNSLSLFEKDEIKESNHALYIFEDLKNDVSFMVISNKGNGLLLPEIPHVSHFLMIRGWLEDKKLTEITEKINQIPFISIAFKLNFKEFANKQNLIFEYDKSKQNENRSYIRTGLLKPRSVRAND